MNIKRYIDMRIRQLLWCDAPGDTESPIDGYIRDLNETKTLLIELLQGRKIFEAVNTSKVRAQAEHCLEKAIKPALLELDLIRNPHLPAELYLLNERRPRVVGSSTVVWSYPKASITKIVNYVMLGIRAMRDVEKVFMARGKNVLFRNIVDPMLNVLETIKANPTY